VQKRAVAAKGWLPSDRFGGTLMMGWADASIRRIDALLEHGASPRLLNDRARERLLAHCHDAAAPDPAWLPGVLEPLERSRTLFPDALVPRFNAIRVCLHFGGPARVAQALASIDEVLQRPPSVWRIDPLDDVLPWDFFPSSFNYRRYFDLVTDLLGRRPGRPHELTSLVLAALHHYRGRYAAERVADGDRLSDAAAAATLDPDFAEYVLFHCRLLIERGRPGDHDQAATELHRLSGQSARILEIIDLAGGLPPALTSDWLAGLNGLAGRLWQATEMRIA